MNRQAIVTTANWDSTRPVDHLALFAEDGTPIDISSGGGETGTLLSPVIHDPVKWYWGGRGDTQITGQGSNSDGYDGSGVGVITNAHLVDVEGIPTSQPFDGAIPEPVEIGMLAITLGVPCGSADAVADGVQVGDRVFWDDSYWFGHQGIYVITDLGSPSSPWVLTRADDHPIVDLLLAFYVEVEDAGITIQTRAVETDPLWLYMAVAGLNALANAPGSYAGGANSAALGGSSSAVGRYSTAVGYSASALGEYATAIGSNTYALPNATAIRNLAHTIFRINVDEDGVIDLQSGGGRADVWIYDDITISTVNGIGLYQELDIRIVNDGDATFALAFPAAWKWKNEMPTEIEQDARMLVRVSFWGDHIYASSELLPE